MPDLIGMPSAKAGERLGELGLGSSWGPPVVVRCEARPRTVVRQRPASGTPLRSDTTVHIRTAALDLDRFRGPCGSLDENVDLVTEADATLARTFYRFAANASLDAPFASGDVWIGIEAGLTSTSLAGSELGELPGWELDTVYAERSGPFSALDTLAQSGGYYELHDGVAGACSGGNDKAPPELDGLRAISLTSPDDVTSACLEWWAVTLFLDPQDRIRGVALRLGSP
ncbi:MAG: PASTA domain-containing protein, partial [Nocardioides sp.]